MDRATRREDGRARAPGGGSQAEVSRPLAAAASPSAREGPNGPGPCDKVERHRPSDETVTVELALAWMWRGPLAAPSSPIGPRRHTRRVACSILGPVRRRPETAMLPNREPDSSSVPSSSPRTPGEAAAADRARVLLETARQLGGSLEPEAIFARLLKSVCGTMRCDGLIVSAFDRGARTIRCSYAWVGGNVLDPETLPVLAYREESTGMQTQVIRTGEPMLFSDVAERVRDPKGTYYEVDASGGMRDLKTSGPPTSQSAIMVPLRLEGEVVGVVQVMADAPGVYGQADLELLEGVSLLLAVALENARLYARAQDEIEERRRAELELRRTEEALREADRRKDEFLATLAHELRNPLNPIRNAVELLRRRATRDAEDRWCQEVIQRQVVHLTRLIDDLLDVSRITQGKLELRRDEVFLHDVVDAAVESVRPIVESLGQELVLDQPVAPIVLSGDPVRLGQVFSNLLDNAAKYTPTGGRIDLRVERRGAEAAVVVRDDGIGISSEHLPHLFNLFYQADAAKGRTHGGLGIGLTLVRRLVEMHGGTIEARSAGSNRGSEFVVRLPVLDHVARRVPEPGAATAPRRSRRILVADDNRDSADSMAMLLRLAGNEVEIAYDGEEALRRADAFRPEVMLVDIGMPQLNGYEVAERLRAEPWGRELVLIAATGWGQEEDRRRTAETGFDAHLVKPVDHDALMQLLGRLPARA